MSVKSIYSKMTRREKLSAKFGLLPLRLQYKDKRAKRAIVDYAREKAQAKVK